MRLLTSMLIMNIICTIHTLYLSKTVRTLLQQMAVRAVIEETEYDEDENEDDDL